MQKFTYNPHSHCNPREAIAYAHSDLEPKALLSQSICHRYPHIVEHYRTGGLVVPAELGLVLSEAKALRSLDGNVNIVLININ